MLAGILAVVTLLAGALLLLLGGAKFDAVPPAIKTTGKGTAGAGSLAPSWYPDPTDPSKLRYWDGQAWTDHTHAAGPQA